MSILHKRSLTTGSVPTTSSLEAGQLAINVPDGRLFLRKSGSGVDQVVSAITTNASNSGSVSLTGSLSISGSGTVFSTVGDSIEMDADTLEMTGSFLVSGSSRFIGNTTVTGSLNVTGSVAVVGLSAGTGSGDVLMYNTASGQFFYTASSAIGGGGGDATSDNFQQIFLLMGG